MHGAYSQRCGAASRRCGQLSAARTGQLSATRRRYSAIKTSSNYQAHGSLQAWLRGIMRRRFQDRLRRERLAELLDEERHGASPADSSEQLDWTRAAVHTSAALADLTEPERSAVLLCDALDLDRDQVAERLNISRGHLHVILHRARGKLAKRLKEQG